VPVVSLVISISLSLSLLESLETQDDAGTGDEQAAEEIVEEVVGFTVPELGSPEEVHVVG